MARTSRAEWTKRVERWKDSGLTAKEFAAETGINASSLNCWSWKLRAEARQEGQGHGVAEEIEEASTACSIASPTAFVELPVATARRAAEPAPAPAMLELLLADDVRVRVPAGFDEATLKRVVRALGSGQ